MALESSDSAANAWTEAHADQEPDNIRPKHWGAMIGSLVLHVIGLVAIGLIIQRVPQGAAVEPGRTAGIVLAKVNSNSVEYFSEPTDQGEMDDSSSSASSSAQALQQAQPQLPAVEGLLPTLPTGDVVSSPTAGNLQDATSLLNGSGDGRGKSGGQTTQVFGVQGTGSKFVYVFDRSSSMEGYGGRPMAEAKRELIASLESLQRTSRFQIVFYNERPTVFNPNPSTPPELLFGTDAAKEEAQGFVSAIRGRGGTRHLDALQAALRMGPDVIFFLTDADEPELTDEELEQVDRWNRSAATIHTIEFGVGEKRPSENFLQKIAKRNLGQYVYRDVSRFGR